MHQESKHRGKFPPRRKPAGGFNLISITRLMMAWCAFRERHVGLKELRVYFALTEMQARRCGAKEGQTPEFALEELRKLVGGAGGEPLRESLRRLRRVGLIRTLSKEVIELSTDLEELTFDQTPVREALDKIPNNDRLIPVPRRVIRLIAGGARRTLIATLLGHLIRCLFYRRGMVHSAGAVKASWVADIFGVSERRVHEQRQHLIELGILIALDTPQRVLNRYGQWAAFNLDWSPVVAGEAKSPQAEVVEQDGAGGPVPPEMSPPPAEISPRIVTPIEKPLKPLREEETRKPASGGPAGFCQKDQDGKIPEPKLRDVRPEDLRDPARLMTLHAQAVEQGAISNSENERLNFFAAANHARVIGSRNPPGLFVKIVRSKLFGFLTQDDEDAARAQVRNLLYPKTATEQSPRGGPYGALSRPTESRPQLSDDARFVRDITRVLKAKGIPESSAWRFVNRERPEWTRDRWDAALLELDPTRSPVVGSLVGSATH